MKRAHMMMVGLLAAGATLWLEARAHAGSCGGGGDSGGGGGGGGDSGSSGSSDSGDSSYDSGSSASLSTVDPEPACVEDSDVLGHRNCSGFGSWAMPRWVPHVAIELGSSVRTFSLNGTTFDGYVDHGVEGGYTYIVTNGEMQGDAAAVGGDLRFLFGKQVYTGMEMSVGGVGGGARTQWAEMPGATATATVNLSLLGGAVVGGRVRVVEGARPVTLTAEVFGGVHTLNMTVDSVYGSCTTSVTSTASRLLVEPRVRAEAWVSPWFSVGAFAGADVLHDNGAAMGLYVGVHSRAFDGVR